MYSSAFVSAQADECCYCAFLREPKKLIIAVDVALSGVETRR